MKITKPPRHNIKVTVRFTEEMYSDLKAVSKNEKVPIAECIRFLLGYALEESGYTLALFVEKNGKAKKRLNDFDPELKAQGLDE